MKDRPYSEDNVTHQIDDLHSINKEKFLASISHNREFSILRKKINPLQSQNSLFTKQETLLKPVVEPMNYDFLQLEKKGYVEKMRRGLMEAKKFDNPALYEMTKKKNMNETLNNSFANVSLEEIKDEINVSVRKSKGKSFRFKLKVFIRSQ